MADQPVLGVEKQQVKLLHPAVTKEQAAVFEQGIKGREQRFVRNLLRCQPPRGLAHHGNRGNGRLTDALDGDQRLRGCGEHVTEGTELRDQRFGQRLSITPGHCREQQDFQHLAVGQRFRSAPDQAVAQAVAMAADVGGFEGWGLGVAQGYGSAAGVTKSGYQPLGMISSFISTSEFQRPPRTALSEVGRLLEALRRGGENLEAVSRDPDRVLELCR